MTAYVLTVPSKKISTMQFNAPAQEYIALSLLASIYTGFKLNLQRLSNWRRLNDVTIFRFVSNVAETLVAMLYSDSFISFDRRAFFFNNVTLK